MTIVKIYSSRRDTLMYALSNGIVVCFANGINYYHVLANGECLKWKGSTIRSIPFKICYTPSKFFML